LLLSDYDARRGLLMPLMTSALTKQEESLLRLLKERFPTGVFHYSELSRGGTELAGDGTPWRILLDRLRKKGWVRLLEKGKYVFGELLATEPEDTYVIAGHLVRPSAVAYRSALNHYGFTEQISRTLYVQTTVRKAPRVILGVPFRFVTVAEHKFFGLRTEWSGQAAFQITDPEKTIIDCFDLPGYAGGFGEALKGFCSAQSKLNKKVLWEYSDKVGNITVMKRIAYIADLCGFKGFEDFKRKTLAKLTGAYSLFDPHSPHRGKHIARWRLLANVSEEAIKDVAESAF
jgi:predicted transcriptional regulator of viral defense system